MPTATSNGHSNKRPEGQSVDCCLIDVVAGRGMAAEATGLQAPVTSVGLAVGVDCHSLNDASASVGQATRRRPASGVDCHSLNDASAS
jgi:hypothetical protein